MIDQRLAAELTGLLGPRGALTGPAGRAGYADRAGRAPAAVLLPELPSEVSYALRLANEAGTPVVPRGAGTSCPDLTYPEDAIVLGTARLSRLLELDTDNLTASVEPGLALAAFQAEVEAQGLFFPPDPANAATATIGGAAGVDAQGPRAFKYGSVKDYVLGLEVVLADGTRLRTGANTVKNASGYDLTRLFVGSHGTLGFCTSLRLRLLPLPAAAVTLVAGCDNLVAALALAESVLAAALVPARLQAIDSVAAQFVGLETRPGEGALLLCELDGSAPATAIQVERVSRLAAATPLTSLVDDDARALWTRLATQPCADTMALPRDRQAEFLAAYALPHASGAVGLSASPSAGQLRLLSAGKSPDSAAAEAARAARSLCTDMGFSRSSDRAAQLLAGRLKAAFDPCGLLNPAAHLAGA